MNQKHRRTKKEFRDYNEYHDRPFGLKWGTAYAMDELMKGIKENETYATKENTKLKQMTIEEIDLILSESLLYRKKVEIQLNITDEFGRLVDSFRGFFQGESYEDYFVINDVKIFWNDIRNISVLDEKKWFSIDIFGKSTTEKNYINKNENKIEYVVDENYQPFFEDY